MNEIQSFNFNTLNVVQAIEDAKTGIIWFVAKEISDLLGYDQTSNALKLCKYPSSMDDFNKINNLHPATKWIPESDMYRLIMRSNKAVFQDFVTEQVLPEIRRNGTYSINRADLRLTNEISHLIEKVEDLSTTVECHKGLDKINHAMQTELDLVKFKLSHCEWIIEGVADTSTRFSTESRVTAMYDVISRLTLQAYRGELKEAKIVSLNEPNICGNYQEVRIPMHFVSMMCSEMLEFKSPKFKTLFNQALNELKENNSVYLPSSTKLVLL
jgi:prophage antirepressor-like protein